MRIDYRELKQRVRLKDLLARIGWTSIGGRGEQLRGPCPLPECRSRPPTERTANDHDFSIHTGKNVYQCFRCKSRGNVLDFWRTHRGVKLRDAAVELRQMLEIGNHLPLQ